jgi:hypothetical protein
MTDFMAFFVSVSKPYQVITQRLLEAIMKSDSVNIVDLCSGAAIPVITVLNELPEQEDNKVHITLTDKYPNIAAFHQLVEKYKGKVSCIEDPVDAANVSDKLKGFRTLFGSFHHFDKETARKILLGAVSKNEGIGIFEYTERTFFVWGLALLFTPIFVMLSTPFIRPLSFRRYLWMVIIPVIPFVSAWDGFVSCLRTYSPIELKNLTDSLGTSNYRWDTGRIRSFGGCYITFLIGYPVKST